VLRYFAPVAILGMALIAVAMLAPTSAGQGVVSSLAFQRTDFAILLLAFSWGALATAAAGLSLIALGAAAFSFAAAALAVWSFSGNPMLGALATPFALAPAVIALAFAAVRRVFAIRARQQADAEASMEMEAHSPDDHETPAIGASDAEMLTDRSRSDDAAGRADETAKERKRRARESDDYSDGDIFVGKEPSPDDFDPDVDERLQYLLMRAREAGFSDDAVAYWRQIQEEFPAYSPAVRGEARVLLQLDRVDEARASLDRALEHAPDDETTLRQAARYAFRAEDWAAAADYWERAFAIEDMGANAAGAYLVALVRADKPQEARSLHREFTDRWPDDDRILAAGAVIYEALNDEEQAFELWNAAAKADTSNFSHRKRAIRALLRGDRYGEALKKAESYAADSADDDDSQAVLDNVLSQAVGADGAGVLDVLESLGGDNASVWVEHMEKRLAANDIEGAEAAFHKAVANGHDRDAAVLRLGAQIAATAENSASAAERLSAFAEAAGDDPALLGEAATSLLEHGEDAMAGEAAEAALKFSADDPDMLKVLATAAANRGAWEKALQSWKRYGAIAGLDEPVIHATAAALRGLERHDEAEELLARGMASFPDSVRLMVDHARVADDREDWAPAIERWRKVVAAAPGNTVAWRKLIGALEKSGNVAEAEAALDAALSAADDEEYLTAAPHVRRLLASRYGDTSADESG